MEWFFVGYLRLRTQPESFGNQKEVVFVG